MSARARVVRGHTNQKILIHLMVKHRLSAAKVADWVCCHRQTVYNWRAGHRLTPDWAIKLLQFQLGT
jgi:hypothetical protein